MDDPVYAEADYVADFFATVRREMQALVEDPGYAALLGAFGPGLLDRTGSRPAVRQADGMGGPVRISHPGQLRAIPNNAILQQLGWMANSVHGLGAAATANPDAFAELRAKSPRFARALAMAARAAACSDIGVLRAVVDTLDPGPWLDRAGFTRRPGRVDGKIGPEVRRSCQRNARIGTTATFGSTSSASVASASSAGPAGARRAPSPM